MTSSEKTTSDNIALTSARPDKLRILQVCSADYFGGGERHVVDLSDMLTARGHAVNLALRPDSPISEKFANVPKGHIEYFPMRNAADVVSAAAIGRYAKRARADLIHAHLARDYPLAALASKLSGVPYVITRHVLFPLGRAHRKLLSKASGVIAPSKAVFDVLTDSAMFPAEKLRLIRYAVDSRPFGSGGTRTNDLITVGSAARLTRNKGHDVLARAAREVLRQRPDVRFQIAGEDPPDPKERSEIEAIIDELGIGQSFVLLGKVDDIPGFLAGLDIYVSASRIESFGLAIVEAMMSKLPIIATRSEGAIEIIEDGKTGILVPIGGHDEIARAILALAADPALRAHVASNARNTAIEEFSLDRMVNETEAFYREGLARGL